MLLIDPSRVVLDSRAAEDAADPTGRGDAPDRWTPRHELQQFIRQRLAAAGLKPHKSLDHALVLETVANAQSADAADVNGIYKMLCDGGHALFMSKLYRVLKSLEQVGLLERTWEDKHGRVRSVYRVRGLVDAARPQSRLICRSCGATTVSNSATLGREIASAARQGGLPIVGDAVVVYVNCETCSARERVEGATPPDMPSSSMVPRHRSAGSLGTRDTPARC